MAASGIFTYDDLYAGHGNAYHSAIIIKSSIPFIETAWSVPNVEPVTITESNELDHVSSSTVVSLFDQSSVRMAVNSFSYWYWFLIALAIGLGLLLATFLLSYLRSYYQSKKRKHT
jgi:hypothetical protein